MISLSFTQKDIVLQFQLQSKAWKVSFRQFAWGDFHAHLLASVTLISMKKKITVRFPGEKIYLFIQPEPRHKLSIFLASEALI